MLVFNVRKKCVVVRGGDRDCDLLKEKEDCYCQIKKSFDESYNRQF
jgi:hypothetical protein